MPRFGDLLFSECLPSRAIPVVRVIIRMSPPGVIEHLVSSLGIRVVQLFQAAGLISGENIRNSSRSSNRIDGVERHLIGVQGPPACSNATWGQHRVFNALDLLLVVLVAWTICPLAC